MTREIEIVELAANPSFGLALVTCGNSETVAGAPSGCDCGCWQEEATQAAVGAADRVLRERFGAASQTDSHFPNWHGGKYKRPDLSAGLVIANVYGRDNLAADGEEPEWSDWTWCGAAALPTELRAQVEAGLEAAADAADKEVAEWEAQVEADRKEAEIEDEADSDE